MPNNNKPILHMSGKKEGNKKEEDVLTSLKRKIDDFEVRQKKLFENEREEFLKVIEEATSIEIVKQKFNEAIDNVFNFMLTAMKLLDEASKIFKSSVLNQDERYRNGPEQSQIKKSFCKHEEYHEDCECCIHLEGHYKNHEDCGYCQFRENEEQKVEKLYSKLYVFFEEHRALCIFLQKELEKYETFEEVEIEKVNQSTCEVNKINIISLPKKNVFFKENIVQIPEIDINQGEIESRFNLFKLQKDKFDKELHEFKEENEVFYKLHLQYKKNVSTILLRTVSVLFGYAKENSELARSYKNKEYIEKADTLYREIVCVRNELELIYKDAENTLIQQEKESPQKSPDAPMSSHRSML